MLKSGFQRHALLNWKSQEKKKMLFVLFLNSQDIMEHLSELILNEYLLRINYVWNTEQ